VAAFWSVALTQALEYRRDAIEVGELWRLLTCHWTHWSPDHLVWDLGMFTLLAALCWQWSGRRVLVAVAAAAVAIPLAVWAFLPEMSHYRGLSGIDSALYVLLALMELRAARARGGRAGIAAVGLLLVAFGAKVAFELLTGRAVFVDSTASSFVPVPLAHLVGCLCGVVAASGSWRWAGIRLRVALRAG
jgi:rhomboid family GlyGly-CTERM serine protease